MTNYIRNLIGVGAIILVFVSARVSQRSREAGTSEVKVVKVWELPNELVEISGNVLLDDQRMACVQDNAGTLYIYNLASNAIEERIAFTGKGDFEGIALVGTTFYVLRADGHLFKIDRGANKKPAVESIDLPLAVENDTESLFYDAPGGRLLIGVKEKNITDAPGKEVYAFDLETNTLSRKPIFFLEEPEDSNTPTGKKKGKKKGSKFKPSEIAIHPSTREVYVLNGPASTLIIADLHGKVKRQYRLDKQLFPQPEGMCFSASGELYISSEGGNQGRGVIARVRLEP